MMADATATTDQARPLATIAREIREAWPKPYFGAVPYIEAMGRLDKITDKAGMEDAADVVTRFLVNASTWRGEHARRIKTELKRMLATATAGKTRR
jgi:hypothetical protein